MMAPRQRGTRKSRQGGYALLLVVFMATVLLLFSMAVAPNIRTEGQREKEKEMIWRGKQYARAVKLYYRKTGRFPTSIDDLAKSKLGSLRFLRQPYKDPMNTQDGSWRLIYVGPSGQLIGSLKPPQQNLQFGPAQGMGTPASALAAPGAPGSLGATGLSGILGQQGQPGPPGSQPTPAAPGTTSTNPPATTGAPVSADQGANPNAPLIPTGDTPTIMGGNIIGVGSKINRSSIMIYEHAKNYRLFEFIWDPSKDTFGVGQPGMQVGTGLGQAPGQMPSGQPGQNPMNPPPNPPLPQNPMPQQ